MQTAKEYQDEITALKELNGTTIFVSQANLNRSYSQEYYKLSGYHGVKGILSQTFIAIGYFPEFYDNGVRLYKIGPDGSYGTHGLYTLHLGVSAREWIHQWPNVNLDLVKNNDNPLHGVDIEEAVLKQLMNGNHTVRVQIHDGSLGVTVNDE